METEFKRKMLHASMVLWALLLPLLPVSYSLLLVTFALLLNLWLGLVSSHGVWRAGEEGRDWGVVWYALSVLILLLLFPSRLEIVAGAWALMALGDSAATVAGSLIRGPVWRWNPRKTVAGTAAFVIAGAPAAALLMIWARYWAATSISLPLLWLTIGSALVAAIVGALVESLDLPVSDNCSVPLISGVLLWVLADWKWSSFVGGITPVSVVFGILVNGGLAWAVYTVRWVDRSGAIGGGILGVLMIWFGGWGAFLLLLTFFLFGTLVTRYEYELKLAQGYAQENLGIRSARHALANCGWALALAVYGAWSGRTEIAGVGIAAALATALADTVSSELGPLFGRKPFLLTDWRTVPPGTDGAVSVEGTLLGVGAALVTAVLATLFCVTGLFGLPLVVIGATVGFLAESYITARADGNWDNEILNLLNTMIGSLCAIALYVWLV